MFPFLRRGLPGGNWRAASPDGSLQPVDGAARGFAAVYRFLISD